jgi:MFS family permease
MTDARSRGGPRLVRRLGPFRHAPYLAYWGGGFLSNLGTWLQAVAGSVFVYQLTGSVFAVGILNFVGFLPIILFSVTGGVIADRFDRRAIVAGLSIVSLVIATGLAVLAFAGVANELHVIAVAFALNTSYAFMKPALIALIPSLVPREELTDAVGMNSLQFILGQIVGPILATFILATGGAAPAFAINAFTFVGPILAMGYLARRGLGARGPAMTRTDGSSMPAIGAVAFVREHRWVLAMLVGVVACSAPLEVLRTLSPAIVSEGLGEPESAAGLIVAAQSVGSAIALLVFVPLRRRGWSRQMAAVGLGLQGIGLFGTAIATTLPVAAVTVALVGGGFSLCFPVLTGALQEQVPDAVRGRVMSFHQVAHLGNRPLVALSVGALAALVGAQAAVLGGLALVPIGLLASRVAWRRLRSEAEPVPMTPAAGPAGPAG